MSKAEHAPETPATKFLKANQVPFSSHLYAYEEHGGTKVSARELNVDEHAVVKTLIFEDANACTKSWLIDLAIPSSGPCP